MTAERFVSQIDRIRATEPDADRILLTSRSDIRWACGFTGSNGLLVIAPDRVVFLTDGRYTEQAHREVQCAEISVVQGPLLKAAVGEHIPAGTTVIIQGDHVWLSESVEFDSVDATWVPRTGLVSPLRAGKTVAEVERIRAAQALTEEAYLAVVDGLEPGVSEREVAAQLVYRHLIAGASSMAFDPIVAFGPNSALPHARPSNRTLARGEPVLIDVGCYLDGYASDMTRMACLGTPSQEFLEVHATVLRALEGALTAARAGMRSDELDRVARDVVDGAGYEGLFTHSLGHGVGLDVHEAPPVSFRSKSILPRNAVVTLEPGIYLPGRFGVRIEDIALLTPDGADRITTLSPELNVL